MKTKFPERETFDLPALKLEAALEVAAKALDYPAHRMNTPSRKPEAQLPVDALCLLHEKAQRSVKLTKATEAAQLAMESALMLMNNPQPGMPALPAAWKHAFFHNCGLSKAEAGCRDALR